MTGLLAGGAKARLLRGISEGFTDSTLTSNGFRFLCRMRGLFNYTEDM